MLATVTNIGSASSTVHYFEQDGYYAKGDPEHRNVQTDERQDVLASLGYLVTAPTNSLAWLTPTMLPPTLLSFCQPAAG